MSNRAWLVVAALMLVGCVSEEAESQEEGAEDDTRGPAVVVAPLAPAARTSSVHAQPESAVLTNPLYEPKSSGAVNPLFGDL